MYRQTITALVYLWFLESALGVTLPTVNRCQPGFWAKRTMETHEENVRDRYHAIPPASVFGDESVAANRLWTGFTNRLSLAADVWKLSFIQRLMRVDQKLPVRDGSNNLLNSSTGLEISSPADTSTVSFPIWAKADVHKRDEAQQGSENSIFGNLTQTTILPTPLPMDAFLPVTSNSESRISAPSTNDLAIGEVSHVADPPPSGALSDPPFRTVPSPDFPSQTTSSPPLPLSDDCKQCFIIYKYVSVYYPPATSSNTDCLTNGAEMPSPSLPPGLEPEPGSAYVVVPELSAGNACTKIAEFTSLTFSFGPGELSTIQGPANVTKEFNFADLPCPPPDVAADVKWLYNPEVNPTRPYMPVIAPFSQLYDLHPAFHDCHIDPNQGFDPAIAVPPAKGPTLPKGDSGKLGPWHPKRHPVGAHKVPHSPMQTDPPLRS